MRVRADRALVRVVLENLLGNAWKFTARCAEARVRLGQAQTPGGETACFVADNGAGFDMACAGKLFTAFQRLHAAADFEGTGIGLAIVQRIIHRHGGRVWAEGEPGRGATFSFTLPDR
jgi:light-regulated signal transduction histidine kinase (bacteriophytochrome)